MKNFPAIWKNIKGVKVEFLEKNIFLFRFASAQDHRRILLLGPWHFDRALVILTLLLGNGDLTVQCFNKVAFWVQFIMCHYYICQKRWHNFFGVDLERWRK